MRKIPCYLPLVLALVCPSAALAQGGSRPRPLPLGHAEEVTVTRSPSGEAVHGYLMDLSPTTLAILINGQRVEMPIDSVLRIDGGRDSLTNGAVIGAAILAGAGLVGCSRGHGSNSSCAISLALKAGGGALIGAAIDAMHDARTTIYRKPVGGR